MILSVIFMSTLNKMIIVIITIVIITLIRMILIMFLVLNVPKFWIY